MIAPGTEPGLWQTARALVARDMRLLWRRRGDALQPLLFALLVVVLFALALGRDPEAMARVAAAVMWLAVLLAEMLHLPHDRLPMLLASLLLGTPLLSLIGGVVAALTVGIRRSGILVALLSLPLYVPVLVFGAGSLAAAGRGQDPVGALLMLGAGLLVALVLAPLATAAAIRISLS